MKELAQIASHFNSPTTDLPRSISTASKKMEILMCAPHFFDIEYEINPWMNEDNPVLHRKAKQQWNDLMQIYTDNLNWDVKNLEPAPGLPDLVFTANGGLIRGEKVVLPHFRHPDRQGETEKFKQWFAGMGYRQLYTPKYDFEGEGDALFWNDILFAGYPWRTDRASHKEVAQFLDVRVISLQLTDARFYHLDTAFTVVDGNTVALYAPAFSEASINAVRSLVPNVIEATTEDALAYGLNAVSDGQNIVIPSGAKHLAEAYRQYGLQVFTTDITEFQKSGGGVKCLTLNLKN